MMMGSNLSNSIKCLFGFHDYTIPTRILELNYDVFVCRWCYQDAHLHLIDYELNFDVWYRCIFGTWGWYKYLDRNGTGCGVYRQKDSNEKQFIK